MATSVKINPDKNLQEQVELSELLLSLVNRDDDLSDTAIRLAELIGQLDGHLHSGGQLPQRWKNAKR